MVQIGSGIKDEATSFGTAMQLPLATLLLATSLHAADILHNGGSQRWRHDRLNASQEAAQGSLVVGFPIRRYFD